MRTYSHGAIGYLLYLKGTVQQQKLAVIGAMVPDVILAIGFIFHFMGESAVVSFLHNLFHHSVLHKVTEAMHSFVFVVPLLILTFFFFKKAVPFFVGMLSHVVIDLLTHQRMGYNHLFPLPFEPVHGIVSYTSLWFTIIEHVLFVVFLLWFLRRVYGAEWYKTIYRKIGSSREKKVNKK